MAVSSTINRVAYAGDNASTSFPFPYYFFAQTDLMVFSYVVSTGAIAALALGTGFTVSGTPNAQGLYPNGANVVLPLPLPTGTNIVIVRNPPETQSFSLGYNGVISSTAVVQQMDYLTLLIQRLQDLNLRSVVLPDGSSASFNPTLPSPLPASSLLATNPTATGFQTYPIASLMGAQGPVGATGPAGAVGPTGATGAAGTNAVTLTLGTVTTTAAGTNASITNTGTTMNPVLNFSIPRGYPGAQGDVGVGIPGIKGADGLAATINVTATTTLEPGQVANVTNEGDTKNANFHFYIPRGLKGDKGDTGAQGLQGQQGAGVRPGGLAGQVLTKNSGTDFDTYWTTPVASSTASIVTKNANYAMGGTDQYVICTASGISITLPVATGNDGKQVTVKALTAPVTIAAASGENIEGTPTIQLTRNDMALNLICTNGVWYVY